MRPQRLLRKQLISDSVAKIEGGNTLVNKSGETMTEIVTAIKRVNDIMAEIAAASVEQASGIEEVNTAVSQMDEMTQQNAALVQQAAAAAESLRSQTEGLQRQIGAFQLDPHQSDRAAAVHVAPVRNEMAAGKQPGVAAERKTDNRSSKPKPGKKLNAPERDDDSDWESF